MGGSFGKLFCKGTQVEANARRVTGVILAGCGRKYKMFTCLWEWLCKQKRVMMSFISVRKSR